MDSLDITVKLQILALTNPAGLSTARLLTPLTVNPLPAPTHPPPPPHARPRSAGPAPQNLAGPQSNPPRRSRATERRSRISRRRPPVWMRRERGWRCWNGDHAVHPSMIRIRTHSPSPRRDAHTPQPQPQPQSLPTVYSRKLEMRFSPEVRIRRSRGPSPLLDDSSRASSIASSTSDAEMTPCVCG
jgi:hypothetical protein